MSKAHGLQVRQGLVLAAGHRGRYLAAGEGPVVVLLASMIVGARSYRPTLAQLARSFRVLVLEMPGSGRGSRVEAPWRPLDYAGWLRDALGALGISRSVVIGHSNSGAVALLTASMDPERVESLVLVDSIGAERSSLQRLLLRRTIDSWFELRATPALARDAWYNALAHGRNFRAQVRSAAELDVVPWAARVTAPVLLAWGAKDYTLPLSQLRQFRTMLPHAQVYVSPGGHHDWLIEQPEELAAALRRFLGSHVSGKLLTTEPGSDPRQGRGAGRSACGAGRARRMVRRE